MGFNSGFKVLSWINIINDSPEIHLKKLLRKAKGNGNLSMAVTSWQDVSSHFAGLKRLCLR